MKLPEVKSLKLLELLFSTRPFLRPLHCGPSAINHGSPRGEQVAAVAGGSGQRQDAGGGFLPAEVEGGVMLTLKDGGKLYTMKKWALNGIPLGY